MKAIVYEKQAGQHHLSLREVNKPVQTADQVLVKIHATSLNAADYRSMRMGLIPKSRIFGADIAGQIEAVGNEVGEFTIGERVFGDILAAGWGGLAEYVAVPASYLARIPAGVSYTDAASLPIAAITALQGLREIGGIAPGKKVLIYGAAGGVGTFAVQLARQFGAEVSAVCSTRNVELVKSLGASRVFDYTREDFSSSGTRYDLILAVNGSRSLRDYLRSLNAGGVLAVVGGSLSQIFSNMAFGPILSLGSKKLRTVSAKPDRSSLEFLAGLVADGSLKPVIDRIIPLEEVPEAMLELSKGHSRGKILVRISQE